MIAAADIQELTDLILNLGDASGSGSASLDDTQDYSGEGIIYEYDEGAIFGVLVAAVSVTFVLIFANAMFNCGPFKSSAPAVESAPADGGESGNATESTL